MLDLKNIQEKIATAIKNSGKTQTHIARALNVTQSCIAHYIKGDITPSLDTFAKLCVLLDEDPKELLCIDMITPQEKIDMILYAKADDQKNQLVEINDSSPFEDKNNSKTVIKNSFNNFNNSGNFKL